MYTGVCLYVKTRTGRKRELNSYLRTCVCVRVCVSSGMSKSLNLLVIQAHCSRVNVFECVRLFFLPCVLSSCRLCVASILLNKKFWVLILFEWIEIRYFKFTRVDFILGQLKFKCSDV